MKHIQVGMVYTTKGGRHVLMMEAHNSIRGYETVSDQHGHHRYNRSTGDRCQGRCTGSPDYSLSNLNWEVPPRLPTDREQTEADFTLLQRRRLDKRLKAMENALRTIDKTVTDSATHQLILDAIYHE